MLLLSYKTRGLALLLALVPLYHHHHHHHHHPRPRAVVARPSPDFHRSRIHPHQPLCASCEGSPPQGARGDKTRVFFRHVLRFRFLSFYLMVPFFISIFFVIFFSCCHDPFFVYHITLFLLCFPPTQWGGGGSLGGKALFVFHRYTGDFIYRHPTLQ
jgi:hypothetical protein